MVYDDIFANCTYINIFVKIWNNLDSAVKCTKTKNSTKNLIKNKARDKYKSFNCNKQKCFVCKNN